MLFLDVDGVLNTSLQHGGKYVHPLLVKRLKKVVDATNCKIIMSSTWRKRDDYMQYLRGMLEDVGISSSIAGATPSLPLTNAEGVILTPEQLRADEIKAFVRDEGGEGVKRWAAVDDLDLNRELGEHFVRTNVESGLSSTNVVALIEKMCDTDEIETAQKG